MRTSSLISLTRVRLAGTRLGMAFDIIPVCRNGRTRRDLGSRRALFSTASRIWRVVRSKMKESSLARFQTLTGVELAPTCHEWSLPTFANVVMVSGRIPRAASKPFAAALWRGLGEGSNRCGVGIAIKHRVPRPCGVPSPLRETLVETVASSWRQRPGIVCPQKN